jgi:Sec-independent protein translocase protein TatA
MPSQASYSPEINDLISSHRQQTSVEASTTEKIMSKSTQKQAGSSIGNQAAYEFKAAIAKRTADEIMAYAERVEHAFVERQQFELDNASGNADAPIVKKLASSRKSFSMPDTLRGMIELDLDPEFINGTLSKDGKGKRFNIYAIKKASQVVDFMLGKDKLPEVLSACLKSMVAFKASGEKFTEEFSKAAVSDKIRLASSTGAKLLTRHNVDKATASTQASSNMRILQALGLVKNVGSARAPVYEFANTNQTSALLDLLKTA